MKRSLLLIFSLSLLTTACTRFNARPAAANPAAQVTQTAPAPAESTPPAPDLAGMSFVEKNNLYLELLNQRLAEGMDTGPAEEAYTRSLEATMRGNSQQADQYLQQAILLLWKP